LILRDMEDRPYDEIAALLGVPLGTVKSRLARSREKLRQTLAPLLKDEP
jgi:RNA polymerase sigma-70 factor, ECF subfamily